jgi:hypothetical protein
MENLFQLLIFLFIIYTIFNAVFGKKKPQAKGGNVPQRNPEAQPQNNNRRAKPSSDELLQELFGFKIPKTGGEYETLPPSQYPTDLEIDLPAADNQPSVESTVIPDVDYDKLPSLENQKNNVVYSKEYQAAYEQTNKANYRTLALVEKFKEPKTLQDLFLISEILNKPKALRK